MDAAIPTIEVSHDADAFCAGGPDGELNTADAFKGDHVGAEFFVGVVMAALTHEVEIKFAEYDGKGIRIEDFEWITGVCASLNLVTARGGRSGLVGRPAGFEEAFGAKLHGVGDFRRGKLSAFHGVRLQGNAGLLGPRQKEAHRPVAVRRMRAEEGKGIGVAGGKNSVDLRAEARIAGSIRCRMLQDWALLRQVSGLHQVANEGAANKLNSNADPRPLNSRAFARKCQTIRDGGVPARIPGPSDDEFSEGRAREGTDGNPCYRDGDACECPWYGLECEGATQLPCGAEFRGTN